VVDSPTLSLQGVATDDRGIQRVEFRVGGREVGTFVPVGTPAEPARSPWFVRELPLERG